MNITSDLLLSIHVLIDNISNIKKNNKVIITGDHYADWKFIKIIENYIKTQGAQSKIIKHNILDYPCQGLASVLEKSIFLSDIWLDFSSVYSLYSTTYYKAIKKGCRYICLSGMNSDMAVRMLCAVNHEMLSKIAIKLNQLSQRSKRFRLISKQGSDFSVEIDPQVSTFDIPSEEKSGGFGQMLGGQIGFSIFHKTLNGCMVFDGTIWPPNETKKNNEPVILIVNSGKIVEITGGRTAYFLKKWLEGFNNHEMFDIDHICYGFHPNIRQLTGNILEDERLFGCVQIGIGRVSEGAPSHCDAIIKKPSIWLDDIKIESDGNYIEYELVNLIKKQYY